MGRFHTSFIGRASLRGILPLTCLTACGAGGTPPPDQPAGAEAAPSAPPAEADRALAEMYPTQRSEVSGTIVLRMAEGGLLVKGQLRGLPAGSHALAIHETGDCTAHDGKSAGGFFNPGAAEAPAGLLGDIKTTNAGQTEVEVTIPTLSLSGSGSVLERSLVVHAWPYDPNEDLEKVPYLACGVIRAR